MVYSSWVTMQERGETDVDTCQFNDFALVELDPSDAADVNPSVPFFGGPVGLDSDGLPAGEQVYSYGNSPLRMGIEQLSPKVGVSAGAGADTGAGAGEKSQASRGGECGGGGRARSGVPLSSASRPRATAAPSRI